MLFIQKVSFKTEIVLQIFFNLNIGRNFLIVSYDATPLVLLTQMHIKVYILSSYPVHKEQIMNRICFYYL